MRVGMTLFVPMIFGGTSVQVPDSETFCNHCRTRADVKFSPHFLDMRSDRGLTNPQAGCRRSGGLAVGEQLKYLSFSAAQRLPDVQRLAALGIKRADHLPVYGDAADVMTLTTQLKQSLPGAIHAGC